MNPQTVDQIRWNAQHKEKIRVLTFMLDVLRLYPDISAPTLLQQVAYRVHPDHDVPQDLLDEIDTLAIPDMKASIAALEITLNDWDELNARTGEIPDVDFENAYDDIEGLQARLAELGEDIGGKP